MRAFITFCLFASAYAKPQGYSYQNQQHSFHNQQNSFQIKLPAISSTSSAQQPQQHSSPAAQEAPSFLQQTLQNAKLTQSLNSAPPTTYIPPVTIGTAVAPTPNIATKNDYYQGATLPQLTQFQPGFQPSLGPQQPAYPSFGQQQYQQGPIGQSPSLVTKDIYVHVAPEEQEERYQQPVLPPPPPRKHYRIVFIKAPSPKLSAAALHVNQAPTEEKTIIYVLTRKPDPIDLAAAYQEAAPKQPSKPEVYFIKYRTQEEAQHAQRTIQEQYDQLGGTTQITDEGISPITSVIGSLDQQHGDNIGSNVISSTSSSSGSSSGSGGISKYLPPIVRL